MTFSELNLNTLLLNALDDLGLKTPTTIQERAFPIVMSGKDVIGIAQTGTGKTFAYLLPILKQLKYSEQKHPRVLIVVPTRELVVQVVGEIKKLTTYITVRVAGVYGGTNMNTQIQVVYNGIDILVATPGRLIDLALTGNLRLKAIQQLVIDEVDEMLNLGFRPQLANLIDMLPEKRQNLMFSATITEEVENFIQEYFGATEKIEAAKSGTPLENIKQLAYIIPNFYSKINLLIHLLEDEAFQRVLVFVSTKKNADLLHEELCQRLDEEIGIIHSNKSQSVRLNTVRKFENGGYRLIIATDLVSRGIDISEVSHVINFDLPASPENFIHRIGRTGRAKEKGVAISFIGELDAHFRKPIEQLMGMTIPEEMVSEAVEIVNKQAPFEIPEDPDQAFRKLPKPQISEGGAFHEKSDKNKKINLGGPTKRNPPKTKPINRGRLKRKS